MLFFIIAFIIIICILLSLNQLYKQEIRHLLQQLEQVENGSQIELTVKNIRSQEFLELYRKLNEMADVSHKKELKYKRAQNQLKQTISNMAHDIRTPLTSAAGYLQMLTESSISEKRIRYESIIQKRIEELKDMLEELFLYTKLTSDDFTLDCRSTSVFPILSDCLLSFYHMFEEKEIVPDIQFEDETICILATHESLERIFRNLIHNALLHGDGGFSVVQKGTAFTFTNRIEKDKVIDTDKMFDRFYKADHSRKRGSSGLGLSIVKELVTCTGGKIEAGISADCQLSLTITFLPAAECMISEN